MKVALIGGTGFVGGYLVDALLKAGHEPSLLVRAGSEAKVRQASRCRLSEGDLDDPEALDAAVEGCDAVIYNVGLLREYPRQGITFEQAHSTGVQRTIRSCQAAGVRRFILMSANGVRSDGTPYQETKRRGETALIDSSLDYTIFRPSVIFGDPRGTMEIATQLYQDLVRPPLPAVAFCTGVFPGGAPVLMSPVHVEDVAEAFVNALEAPQTRGKIISLGGPEILSWRRMVQCIASAAGRHKLIVPMPIGVMQVAATFFDWLPFFPATRDQLRMLAEGNTAQPDALQQLIGREARPFSAENLQYLGQAR
jgi:NADH dehydrogenase